MAVHDWTRAGAGVFHDFHGSWVAELKKALNAAVLPENYYAMAEPGAQDISPHVLPTQACGSVSTPLDRGPRGATAVKETPPKVRFTAVADESEAYALKRRSLVIRHTAGDVIVALVEILSPGNKNRQRAFERFLDRAFSALRNGYHLLLVDLHPPRPHDPRGIHGALWAEFEAAPFDPPPDKPLTLASYSAGTIPRAYVETVAVGSMLPKMPLFLDEDWYVNVPLETTYGEAYQSVPERWRRVLENTEGSL